MGICTFEGDSFDEWNKQRKKSLESIEERRPKFGRKKLKDPFKPNNHKDNQ